jgi:hypothetical protein
LSKFTIAQQEQRRHDREVAAAAARDIRCSGGCGRPLNTAGHYGRTVRGTCEDCLARQARAAAKDLVLATRRRDAIVRKITGDREVKMTPEMLRRVEERMQEGR